VKEEKIGAMHTIITWKEKITNCWAERCE